MNQAATKPRATLGVDISTRAQGIVLSGSPHNVIEYPTEPMKAPPGNSKGIGDSARPEGTSIPEWKEPPRGQRGPPVASTLRATNTHHAMHIVQLEPGRLPILRGRCLYTIVQKRFSF